MACFLWCSVEWQRAEECHISLPGEARVQTWTWNRSSSYMSKETPKRYQNRVVWLRKISHFLEPSNDLTDRSSWLMFLTWHHWYFKTRKSRVFQKIFFMTSWGWKGGNTGVRAYPLSPLPLPRPTQCSPVALEDCWNACCPALLDLHPLKGWAVDRGSTLSYGSLSRDLFW